jgi:hypothetical protein
VVRFREKVIRNIKGKPNFISELWRDCGALWADISTSAAYYQWTACMNVLLAALAAKAASLDDI